ncbi:alpha/beta fold hydrolase [Rhodococcus sp. NPDC004095]
MSDTEFAVDQPLHHGWAGARGGPVTVVLHGGGPGCHATSDFHDVLTRGRRRWLWIDLPGYGGSAAASHSDTPATGVAADAVSRLLAQLDLTGVDVLAQSLGGSVALRLASEHPETVRRMVVIGSQPSPAPGGRRDLTRDSGLAARIRTHYYGGSGPSEGKMRKLLTTLEWHDATRIPADTVAARYRSSLSPLRWSTGTTPAPADDLTDHLAGVRSPTLVVWGRHDPFAGPDYAAAVADALPRGDLAVLAGTAHHPQAERPDLVAALADAFLDHDPVRVSGFRSGRY